jgi:hypothetical protein
MQGSLIRALLMGALVTVPAVSNAASVRIQNANFDVVGNKIIVKGVLDAIPAGTTVRVIQDSNNRELAQDADGNKQFGFQIPIAAGQAVPCHLRVEAGEEVAFFQVRNSNTCDQKLLTLQGQVVDEPIPYATVTVTLNGVTYTTVADENGFYTLDIATATISELVTIEATRRNENGETVPIDFVSLAGSFSKLLADADGGVLSSDKSQKTNITNVSTAEYVLLVEANGGTAPTTVEELQQAETKVDATELIELAAVIKLIVDGGQALPQQFNTILEFIQEPAAVETFVAALPEGELEATVAQIIADNDLVAGFQVDQVPARYFVSFPAEPGFLPRGGDVYEFSTVRPNGCAGIGSGCTGYYMTRDVRGSPIGVPIEWYIELGTLEMAVMAPTALSRVATPAQFASDLPNAVMTDGTPFSSCAATANLDFIESIVGYSFTRFNDGQTVDGLSRRSDLRYSNFQPVRCSDGQTRTPADVILRSTGNVLARDSGSIAPRRFVRASAAPVAADEIVADGQWALQVLGNLLLTSSPSPQRSIFADNVRLNADGTSGSDIAAEQGGGPSSWTVDAVTGELVITYPDGWVQRVIVTDELDGNGDGTIDQYGAFSVFTGPGGERFASSDPAFRRDNSLVINAGLVGSPLGKYWQTVVNAWTPDAWEDVPGSTTGERRLKVDLNAGFFGFRAAPVGSGFRAGSVFDVASPLCPGGNYWSRVGFIGFEVSESGTLNVVGMTYTFNADPLITRAHRTRIWSVLSVDSVPNPSDTGTTQRRLSVIELERFEARDGSPHNFPPRVNFYREYTEPSIDRGLCEDPDGFAPLL